ncbi:MAG: aromatic ring-hydroxylating dioxygenase subunit alpha [Alphaproteobacteria bacterium]|nr:aromatic ring-hydroxylating dioxygenase subunit alpha [Alphaproteobacteria bacterium]
MFRSVLPADAYLDDRYIDLENQRIFQKLWVFAGIRSTLSKKNAFLTRTIGGVPVVVTTVDGITIRVFENQCRHRQMPLQSAAFGNRPMVCPYHAWSYDQDGKLRAVANAHLYQMRQSEKDSIGLREFAVRVIGNLIFVNLSENPLPIEEQFDPKMLAEVAECSSFMDARYAYTSFEVNYNWKLGYENAVDYNHVPFVHPSSVYKLWKKEGPDHQQNAFSEDMTWDLEETAHATAALPDLSCSRMVGFVLEPRPYTPLMRRYGDKDIHHTWFMYPNMGFGTIVGEWFVIQQYEPIAPDRTRFHLWTTTAQSVDHRKDFIALKRSVMEAEKRVVDEDVPLLEGLQRSLYRGCSPALLGAYERPIARIGKWYRDNVMA